MSERPSRSGTSSNPPPAGQPTVYNYDQMQVMAMLVDIAKDVTSLNEQMKRVADDLGKVETTTSGLKDKMFRAEVVGITIAGAIVVLAIVIWWLFGEPITYLRNQLINQNPQISVAAPAVPTK